MKTSKSKALFLAASAYLQICRVHELSQVTGNAQLVDFGRGGYIGRGIVQIPETSRSDGSATACRDHGAGYRDNRSSSITVGPGLDKARTSHATKGAKVSCWSNDVNMGVELLWKRVAKGSDDFIARGTMLIDIVLRAQHLLSLCNGHAKGDPVTSARAINGAFWANAVKIEPGIDSLC